MQLQDTDVTITAMVPEEMVSSMNEGDSGIFCGIFMTRTGGDQAARFDAVLFRVTFFRRQGVGELYEAKENLRTKLQSEGMLDRESKQFPEIAERGLDLVVVSSQRAKGFTDIATSLRQSQSVRISLKSCNLMNPEDIVRAIKDADNTRADVLVVARGGGEGLGIFDREEVVRAIASCRTYTVAAIGHADDTTLANEVADYAVITPTMAATYIIDRVREHEMKRQRTEQQMVM